MHLPASGFESSILLRQPGTGPTQYKSLRIGWKQLNNKPIRSAADPHIRTPQVGSTPIISFCPHSHRSAKAGSLCSREMRSGPSKTWANHAHLKRVYVSVSVWRLVMDSSESNSLVFFGPFEVNLRTQEIRRHGTVVRLSRQPFQILEMLLAHPGELVTRDELQRRLWPGASWSIAPTV